MPHFEEYVGSIKVGPNGRVVVPAVLRKALGMRQGDTLVARVEGDALVLRPRWAVEKELWDLFENVEGSLSDELIEQRHKESAGETEG